MTQQRTAGAASTVHIDELEQDLWQAPGDPQRLAQYQRACREQGEQGARHRFIIVIPLADRPQHLAACLDSILTLCERFGYGGRDGDGCFRKVEVLIADDSREADNIARHRELAHGFRQRGLRCHYFGQAEQLAQMAKLDPETRKRLRPILGDTPAEAFFHKGASVMRNISYLRLHEMIAGRDDTLIYFIDSDQEFQVRIATEKGGRNLYAINYLYQLDRLFRERDIAILTGKVVGDPPVSPAVMASNFLDDVSAFITSLAALAPEAPCRFHGVGEHCDDAAYHDMAELFGFTQPGAAFDYRCGLEGAHDHAACLAGFAARLQRFFDGEHPTRQSYYRHRPLDESVVPARTVYTGNYCLRGEALRYFIPFATLRLRMAGPVLGRLIKAELGARFVSANLPMLHKRTVDELGQSEFRPGIERSRQRVDLCGEYERQFFGDVMLFSIARLSEGDTTLASLDEAAIRQTVDQVASEMLDRYSAKQRQVSDKIARLQRLFAVPESWWHRSPELAPARQAMADFLDNMAANFGDEAPGLRLIHDASHRARRLHDIAAAIDRYPADRAAWESLLG